jgi:DNA-directed RNA polymerase specialized sigma24 family protein
MFTTTCWTAVVEAGRSDSASAKEALTRLCGTYWHPLYAYLRRLGQTEENAKDLTQEFFYLLLSKNYLRAADRTKGRFRSFLLTALKHFLANDKDRQLAAKRGGREIIISLNQPPEDGGALPEPGTDLTPAAIFERRWAATLFRQAENRLRDEYADQRKAELFARLRSCLEGETRWGSYGELAGELGLTSASVAMAVHRMRARYAVLLREEVAQTLVRPTHSEIEEELRHLFEIFGG